MRAFLDFAEKNKLFTGLGTALILLAIGGSYKIGTSNSPSSVATTVVHTTTVTRTITTPSPPESTPTPPSDGHYLKTLAVSSGDAPTPGDIHLAGHNFADSVFYEKLGEAQSTAKWCAGEPYMCRATAYEIGGKYHSFTAVLGLTEISSSTPHAQWQVVVDGVVEKSNPVPVNTALPVNVSIAGGHLLELRVKVEEASIADSVTIIWGDAKVS